MHIQHLKKKKPTSVATPMTSHMDIRIWQESVDLYSLK